MKYIIGLFLVFNISASFASDWNCRNHDLEISCNKGKYEVSDGFTPLDIYFDSEDYGYAMPMTCKIWEKKK